MEKKFTYILIGILFVGCIALGIYTNFTEKKVKDLNEKINAFENNSNEIASYKKKNADLNDDIKSLKKEIEQLKKDKQTLEAENAILKAQVSQATSTPPTAETTPVGNDTVSNQ